MMTKMEYYEKCQITFPSNKGTAHTLTKLAHLQNKKQPQLLQEICEAYIAEKMIEIINKTPPELLNELNITK